MSSSCRIAGRACLLLAAVFISVISAPVPATNGTNALALSAEAFAIGGADIGFIRDTAAPAVNPANLSQIRTARFEQSLGITDAGDIRHSDGFGNSHQSSNSPIPFATFGYAKRLNERLVAGIAMVGQGGVGFEYENLNTAFGSTDRLKNILRIAKLSSGISYEVNDDLALGASLELLYSDLEQDFFPDTSATGLPGPASDFFGYSIEDAETFTAQVRLGLRYRMNPRTTIGVAYVTPAKLEFKDTHYVADMSAIGLGKVTYKADITRQKQPQEFGIGLAFEASNQLTVVSEVNWINWSNAIDRPLLVATGPSNPGAPASIQTELIQEWDDQFVFSLGVVYEPNDQLVLRAGLNYAEQPVPEQNLQPLLALIGERHAGLGFGYKVTDGWRLDGMLVRTFPNSVTYTNASLPFGPGAEAKFSMWHAMLTVSRIW